MKKSLIALAVVSTFAAQAAMAAGDAVTIYGQANVSLDSVSTGSSTNGQTTNHVGSTQSRLGFKGAEDLGDGLSAIWQIEEGVNFANAQNTPATSGAFTAGTTVFSGRDTFAGLSSASMGTAIFGIHDTPYKMATRGYDLFADSIADNRSIMGTSGTAAGALGDIRLNNVAAYISPAMNGFTFAGATVTAAEIPAAAANNIKGGAISTALLYGAGPLSASFAWQKATIGSANTGTLGGFGTALGIAASDTISEWKLGGGYDLGQGVINAVYEKNSSSIAAGGNAGNPLDRSAFYLAGKYHVNGNDDVKLAYTSAGNLGAAQNTGAKQYALGYDHKLSQRTSVYALYTRLSNGNQATNGYTLATTDTASAGAPIAAATAGGTGFTGAPSAIALGLKHAF